PLLSSVPATAPASQGDDRRSPALQAQRSEQRSPARNAEAPARLGSTSVHDVSPPPSPHGERSGSDVESLRITPRQYDVLTLLARGHAMKTIARMLNISPSTAKCHAASLYRQLNARTKGEADYAARQLGVLPH